MPLNSLPGMAVSAATSQLIMKCQANALARLQEDRYWTVLDSD